MLGYKKMGERIEKKDNTFSFDSGKKLMPLGTIRAILLAAVA